MAIDDKFELLSIGDLNVTGRLVDASNATLYATATHGDQSITCIYKPIAGERPLWDFPDGALAYREYAAFLISDTLGFDLVPLTILRDGPYGFGMVQEWIDIDESIDLGTFFSSDNPMLRSMALFDAIINNTDRKIGHLLPTPAGELFGCDHGVTFHSENKLRTVLWQWAGDPLTKDEIQILERARQSIVQEIDLSPYLTTTELNALSLRIDTLISNGAMPTPNPDWPAVPWPAF
ncbi:unannotated protein [freshwater metagenome]|uniref:Unannotated protein n=1 Tax=freshwater metagenome TaxID=449393 RepID=A0A6J7SED8_9ZZZZ|nr:SCO1664 family protein [Actinomycetota bacterium]MTB08307.1 SCO1664 family protein [Actinomycetota bacterium]